MPIRLVSRGACARFLATVNARRMVSWGFTTIRDIETEGAGYADITRLEQVRFVMKGGVEYPANTDAGAN